jgi:hypothetical protein
VKLFTSFTNSHLLTPGLFNINIVTDIIARYVGYLLLGIQNVIAFAYVSFYKIYVNALLDILVHKLCFIYCSNNEDKVSLRKTIYQYMVPFVYIFSVLAFIFISFSQLQLKYSTIILFVCH